MRGKLILTTAATFGVVAAGVAVRHSEARAQVTESMVYLWKDVNGKCPAACDTSQYACPCKATALEEPEFY